MLCLRMDSCIGINAVDYESIYGPKAIEAAIEKIERLGTDTRIVPGGAPGEKREI